MWNINDRISFIAECAEYFKQILTIAGMQAGSRFIPEAEAAASGHVVTLPSPRLVPAVDILRTWSVHFKSLSKNSPQSSLLYYAEKMLKRVENESSEGEERDRVLKTLKSQDQY